KLLTLLDFYSRQDDFPAVQGAYRRLFRLEPRSVDLRLDYARALYDFDLADRALDVIDALLKANPDDAKLQQRVVDLWVAVGSKAIAIDQGRRLAAAGNDQMKIAIAQLAIGQRRFADAAAILKPYVDKGEITPENVLANTLYASAMLGLGRTDEALTRATRVLAFDKTSPGALLLRVRIMVDRHNLDQALADAQVVGRDNPDLAAARIALAKVYTLRKEKTLADGAFARAADDLPQDLDLLNAYVAYLIDTGRRREALDAATNFTRRNPDRLEGWKARADLCLMVGDNDCLQQVLDAFGRVRGGARAKTALERAMAERQKAGAPVSRPGTVAGPLAMGALKMDMHMIDAGAVPSC
ncbi:MAG: Tetratricopeptide repeat-containing protein, partial [Rhizorhabdus sp.]|nr:Tetratricopeptide repeat-containing protein [Rhizorhabdus sp.]